MFLILTPKDDITAMRVGLGLSTTLFVWTLLHMLAVLRSVAQRGITRALQAARTETADEVTGDADSTP